MDKLPEPIGPAVTEVLALRLLNDETQKENHRLKAELREAIKSLTKRTQEKKRLVRRNRPEEHQRLDKQRDRETAELQREFQVSVRKLVERAVRTVS